MRRRGLLLILSSPSGAGKSTLTQTLVREDPSIRLSVSVTTRPKRHSEIDGVHYRFIEKADFEEMCARDDLLEFAEVHGNHYGTAKRVILDAMAKGEDMILEIDWQGAEQVRRLYPDCVGIFILPPSVEELERRMRSRGQDSEAVIRQRVANAKEELAHAEEFKYAIINKDFETARRELASIIERERAKS